MGIWREDNRIDFYEITDERVKKNADCVAAIMFEDNLIKLKNGCSEVKVKNYGEAFNLWESERFRDQPVSKGKLSTGFLVKDDIIATAGYFVDERNVIDLRIIFGFKMLDAFTPIIQVPNDNIYKAVQIIDRVYNPGGNMSNWALVKLDRKVEGQVFAPLSKRDIYCDQSVYALGHPAGLPLKYASGGCVRDVRETYFVADLDVYTGNSGSPVFDSSTHEVIGIVVRGDTQDFSWTGKGWASVIYPNPQIKSREPQCTVVSEFIDVVDKL